MNSLNVDALICLAAIALVAWMVVSAWIEVRYLLKIVEKLEQRIEKLEEKKAT